MAVVGWLFLCGALLVLTLSWWVIVPFYLGSYSTGSKPPNLSERITTVAVGAGLALAWWLGVVQHAPFIKP